MVGKKNHLWLKIDDVYPFSKPEAAWKAERFWEMF